MLLLIGFVSVLSLVVGQSPLEYPHAKTVSALFESLNLSTYLTNETREDMALTTTEFVVKHGYSFEEFKLRTVDGYILTMYKIMGKDTGMCGKPCKNPVLFVHGLGGSSTNWVSNGPGNSLVSAYSLVNEGHVVYLFNARGNFYSREHLVLNPMNSSFWDFSWHEIGNFDITAAIDKILNDCKGRKIHYVGHSQGTTVFFVALSVHPKYNRNILSMHAMAPAVFMTNSDSSIMKALEAIHPNYEEIYRLLGNSILNPLPELSQPIADIQCDPALLKSVAKTVYCKTVTLNSDLEYIDDKRIPVIMSQGNAGASIKQPLHYLQSYMSNYPRFAQYDFGPVENIRIYGRKKSPEYPLYRITVPVFNYYSKSDDQVSPIDVFYLHSKLKNSFLYEVPRFTFSHIDFILASDAREQVFNEVMVNIKKFNICDDS